MKIIIPLAILWSCSAQGQKAKPTPSYNLLTYKIAELNKRAADEFYIENDLTQTTPLPGNYQLESDLYASSLKHLLEVDTALLFKDKGYRKYAADIGFNPKVAFLLFQEELVYRQTLARNSQPYFVFDPRQTLEDFDTKLPSRIRFYYDQLKKLDEAIKDDSKTSLQLSLVGDLTIEPEKADAQADIKIARENQTYFEDELTYHNAITARYNGILTANVQRQKAIAKAIQKDMNEMDELGKSNAGLLAQALSSYAGIPDITKVSNFIQNPSLQGAVDLAMSEGGSKMVSELGKAASWGKEAVEAFSKVKKIYDVGKKYYETAGGVADFIKNPSMNNFIAAANKVAVASGREDMAKLAAHLEKGKSLWSTIQGCTANVTCECIESALNSNASGQMKEYLETLKSFHFDCNTIGQFRDALRNPSLETLQALAMQMSAATGIGANELKMLKELQDSVKALGQHSGMEKFILMGEIVANKMAPAKYEQLKAEMLGKKPVALLYDLLLSKKESYASLILDHLLPADGTAQNKKLRAMLLDLSENRSMAPGRIMKNLTDAYPELICQAFPAELVTKLKELVKSGDCDGMVSQLFFGKMELRELSFLDSSVLIRGQRISYDFDKIAKKYIAKIIGVIPVNTASKQLLNQYVSKAIPSLRGMVQIEGLGDPPVAAQGVLFDKIMAAPKLAGETAGIKEDLTNTYLGMYSTGKNIGSETFQKEVNAHTSLDSIAYYQPKPAGEDTEEAGEEMPGTADMLKNMLVQGAVNYFAPGAMQALQIMSNLFMQGQIADAVRDKNKELQEAVKDYVDKSLDRDKYQLNAYRAEHDRNINRLIIEGKSNRLKIFEDAGNKFDFKKQLVKEQVEEYSSYYYYLLERLRESFTQYLWAYKKWYGISYREDLLRDPNAVRLILDPQIRYLTFSNYTSLGRRKGTAAIRQWERIIPSLLENHDDRKIEGPDEKQLSEFAAQFEDIAAGQWAAFKKWIVSDNPGTNEFKFRFNVDLLDRVSTERWTISMGDRLQDKLLADKAIDLPAAFRLLGINIIFTDTLNAEIRPNKMFTLVELRLDSITPSMVNYGDRFVAETYSREVREFVDLRNFPVLEKVISGRKIKYFKSLWGIPLQSSFVLTLKKNLSTAASAPTRKSLGDVRAEGFYFTTKSTAFTRSLGDAGTLPLVIDGKTYKVNFGMNDILRTSADLDTIQESLKQLQKQVNQRQP